MTTPRSSACSRRWRCPHGRRAAGLTLVELLAAMAILSVVLSSLLLVRARHVRQTAQSRRCAEAVRAADRLLETWYAAGQPVLPSASGTCPHDVRYGWTTRTMAEEAAGVTDLLVVRLAIHDADAADTNDARAPLAFVDVVVRRVQRQSAEAGR
jgi:prepilin-type N-terminal cleavage/methylation domain-containing protein